MILCDVAREDASVILGDLRELEIPQGGSIAMEFIDSQISDAAEQAEKFAPGAPSDAVVWEQVEAITSENVELSGNFVAFMVLAVLIATAGIFLDSPILIIGAMVVGPEFGPLAGLCVALVEERGELAPPFAEGARRRVPGGDHGRVPRVARNQGARSGARRLRPRRARVHRVHHGARTSSRSSSRSCAGMPECSH